jgi:hypothetical protein
MNHDDAKVINRLRWLEERVEVYKAGDRSIKRQTRCAAMEMAIYARYCGQLGEHVETYTERD